MLIIPLSSKILNLCSREADILKLFNKHGIYNACLDPHAEAFDKAAFSSNFYASLEAVSSDNASTTFLYTKYENFGTVMFLH